VKTLFLLLVLAGAVTYTYSLPFVTNKYINAAREQIIDISKILSKGDRPTLPVLATLQSTLKSIQKTSTAWQRGMYTLDSTLIKFTELQPLNLSVDSLQSLFREIAITFEFTFCDYFHDQAKESFMKKIFLFSTSVSCECTLKMCGEYLEALYSSQRHYGKGLDIVVVDTFHKTDLKDRYKIEFIPTLIVLDENNNELQRFVRDERIGEKLNHVLE